MPVKSKVKISQNFVAFSEYMNFTQQSLRKPVLEKTEIVGTLFFKTMSWELRRYNAESEH